MVGSHQIGAARVDVSTGGVVATLPQRPAPIFRNQAHTLGGVWLGNRIAFGPDKADRVLDLVRTHYGMDAEADPLGLGPAESTRLASSSLTIVVPHEIGDEEDDELSRLTANLPILERRARATLERHEAAQRALDGTRDRIAALAGRS